MIREGKSREWLDVNVRNINVKGFLPITITSVMIVFTERLNVTRIKCE